jgi:hypothetical protein
MSEAAIFFVGLIIGVPVGVVLCFWLLARGSGGIKLPW